MPTNRLWNSLTFTNVPAGDTVSAPHGLINNNGKKVPDWGWLDKAGFTPSADDTNVSVTNDTAGPLTVHVLVCAIHTSIRVLGGDANLSPKPFWVVGSQGSSGSSSPSNLVVWTEAKTWAQVYAEIQALSGPVICLVENNFAGHTMTAEGGGAPTDLTRVQFQGLTPAVYYAAPVNAANIQIEDGFILGLDADGVAVLNGLNVNFFSETTTTSPVGATPFALMLDGGSLTAGVAPFAAAVTRLVAVLSNGATIGDGSVVTIKLDDNGSHDMTTSTGAKIAANAFDSTGGAVAINVITDGSIVIESGAFTTVTPTYAIQGQAGSMALSFGNQSISTASTLRYLDPGYNQGIAGTVLIGFRAPCNGLLHRLAVQFNAADVASENVKCEVYVNNANTGISVDLPADAVGGGTDLTHTALVEEGDLISIAVTRTDVLIAGVLQIAAVVELFGI